MIKHYISVILILFLYSISAQSQDPLVSPENEWTSADESSWNTVVQGLDPFGNTSNLLETSGWNGYKGFFFEDLAINPNTSYRFSFWTKLTDLNPDYFGGWIRTKDASGTIIDGAVFSDSSIDNGLFIFSSETSIFPQANEWYLVVCFVKGNSDGASYASKIFDTSGLEVGGITNQNVKWNTNVSKIDFRSIYVYETATDPTINKAYTYDPRIEVVTNGDDSITDLLPNSNPNPPSGTSIWSETNSIASYTGKVGIGTTTPGNYELAVNGEIRAKEIKVEIADWPDYVFTENYTLPTLEEVQKHIDQNGHLINIPSAKEIEANGLELGKMNRLLLEKIEELTLYMLQQEKRIQYLEHKK
tara:strand:+ start:13621 stop:14697 length:1077 start_codon:yes stop_codon:yes gene_type:complete